jgi:MFS family permease
MGEVAPLRLALRAGWGRAFRSLHERNFRIFVTGHAVSVTGTWMQRVAQDWLVLELSDSAVAVGVATSLQFLPILFFGMLGGVTADRVDRRRLLMATQSLSAALAAVLATLSLTGSITLGMVYGLALALGVVTVFDVPGRQAFLTDMVPPDDYVNAQALNSTIHNAGRLVGPAFAGVLIATAGVGVAFLVNTVSFVAVLAALVRIDSSKLRRVATATPARGQVREGFRYVWAHPDLRACMFLIAVVALFGQNFRVVLPLLARDTFGEGPEAYGWLTSALGVGAVIGALAAATRQRLSSRSLLRWTIVFGLVNLVAAAAPNLAAALVVMVSVGIANITFNTLGRTLLQLRAEPQMQGRVIALHGMIFLGSTPFGGPLLGWVCEQWGARAGFLVAGCTAVLASLPFIGRLGSPAVASADMLPDDDAKLDSTGAEQP